MAQGDAPGRADGEPTGDPAFLIFDTESVPDGRLLAEVKYPGENLSPAEAIRRAQFAERERTANASDFIPVTFHYPVAICILRVGRGLEPLAVTCLDAPQFRPRNIVEEFWRGLSRYKEKYGDQVRFVSFNGRGFDWPLLEMAAFRYGCGAREYFTTGRNRYAGELDLMDWLSNYGAIRQAGGLNLLSKILGKPGKMTVSGDQVCALHQAGRLQEINDYCMFDTLDTYFVFLRTRVLIGAVSLRQEQALVARAKAWIAGKVAELPALRQYLDNWGDWDPWP